MLQEQVERALAAVKQSDKAHREIEECLVEELNNCKNLLMVICREQALVGKPLIAVNERLQTINRIIEIVKL